MWSYFSGSEPPKPNLNVSKYINSYIIPIKKKNVTNFL